MAHTVWGDPQRFGWLFEASIGRKLKERTVQ